MRLPFATALLALALPVLAQDPAAMSAENLFYKAFYLEKGERDFAGAMTLYNQFLTAAPDHRLAKVAAEQNLGLLQRTGKTKEAEEFAKKYEKMLGPRGPGVAATPGEGRPGEGRGPGQGAPPGGGREGMQQRLERLKADLAKAKESGNADEVARLEAQIKRMEEAMARGGTEGPRGEGGRGQGGGRFGTVKFAEMTPEQLAEFKSQRLDRMGQMVERLREGGNEERAKQLEDNLAALKKALDANKLDEAQKVWDKMAEGMRRRGG